MSNVFNYFLALGQVLSQQTPSPPPPTFNTAEQLRLFAHEAKINGDYSLASTYYQEVTELLPLLLPWWQLSQGYS